MTVKVQIVAWERVRYLKVKELTDDEWRAYNDAIDTDMPEEWFREFAEVHLDRLTDVDDSDGFEDIDIVELK